MAFYWSLSDSESPQVSKTLPSILAVLNNIVVWMVSTRLPTSKSSVPFNNPLVHVLKALITIDAIVIFMFHSFFSIFLQGQGIIIIIICDLSTPVLTGVLWLESGWQQVSPGLLGYYYYHYSLRSFHTSFYWCSFTRVWGTESLLKSPELF